MNVEGIIAGDINAWAEVSTTYAAQVTDSTPASLEYGDYRGWIEIDGETGECIRDLTDEEHDALTLGEPEYSTEYGDLRPIVSIEVAGVTDAQAYRPHCPTCRCAQPVCDFCDEPVVVDAETGYWAHKSGLFSCDLISDNYAQVNGSDRP